MFKNSGDTRDSKRDDPRRRTAAAALGTFLLLAAVAAPLRAQTQLGVDIQIVHNWQTGNWVLGFEFDALADLYVTSFGYFDEGKNGLAASHDVGLWETATGTLLASMTIAAGTADPLIGFHRMVDLTNPLTLQAGTRYTIGGTSGGDPFTSSVFATSTSHPQIAAIAGRYEGPTSTLSRPTNPNSNYYLTANFGTTDFPEAFATPEPVSMILLSTGLAGIAIVRRRRAGRNGTGV